MATPNPFPGFTPLGSGGSAYVYSPPSASATKSLPTTPDLIILSAWMGAAAKHILKYTTSYQRTYPSASILLLTSAVNDFLFYPSYLQRQRLAPAASFIRTFKKSNPTSTILLHAFSNGGSQQTMQLAYAYRSATAGVKLPIDAVALDSCPGRGSFKEGTKAFMLGIPPSLQTVAYPLVLLTMVMSWTWTHILGRKNAIDHIRAGLNDDQLFDKRAPRLYFYSRTDRLVRYTDVEQHAEEARKKGWSAERVQVDGSAHVTHMMKDPEAYWGAIKNLLIKAAEIKNVLR